jgi:hypothetical protein
MVKISIGEKIMDNEVMGNPELEFIVITIVITIGAFICSGLLTIVQIIQIIFL